MNPSSRIAQWRRDLGHRGPLIAGHRGDPAHWLENTLPSCLAAAKLGVAVELDVRFSADSVVVVFHDATLERLAGRSDAVSALRWDVLRTVDLVHPHDSTKTGRIPRLAEVAASIPAHIPLLVEIKCEQGASAALSLTRATLEALACRPMDTYAMMSFNPFVVRALRRDCPQILRGYLYETYEHVAIPTWQKFVLRKRILGPWMRPHFWGPNVHVMSGSQVARDRARGQATVVWTADSDAERAHVLQAGADVLITNDPASALAQA